MRTQTLISAFLFSDLRRHPLFAPQLTENCCHRYKRTRHLAVVPIGNFSVERCCNPFDQSLLHFYRANFHEKRSKRIVPSLPRQETSCDDDAVFTLCCGEGEIIAALRLTRSKQDDKYSFLRSLCVARSHRGNGLSLLLMEKSLNAFNAQFCYCFASPYLENLYQRAGFERIHKGEEMKTKPKWLVHSYKLMDARWSRKTCCLFIKPPSTKFLRDGVQCEMTTIILIQHHSEESKKTATGWLLNDEMYFQKFSLSANNGSESIRLSNHFNLQRWIWKGRDDAAIIDERIKGLASTNIRLLWTDGNSSNNASASNSDTSTSDVANSTKTPTTYIILDGTWQQARMMYRKNPHLWTIPRVSFDETSIPPSSYVLRGDYSNWRDRFSSPDEDGKSLLCTAEAAAAVMDREGNAIGANAIRKRLETFQHAYFQNNELFSS